MKHRLFWAFSVPDSVQNTLASLQSSIEGFLLSEERIRFVRAEDMHITGQYLGEQEEENIPALLHVLERMSATAKPLSLQISGLDFFPKSGDPSALYASVAGKSLSQLQDLREKISSAVSLVVEPVHSHATWEPHITLGRINTEFRRSVAQQISVPNIPFNVAEIVLYKSVLSKDGPTYTCLGAYSLS